MILSHRTEINLFKSYDKVLLFYPAFNKTFAFLAHRQAAGIDLFVHCDHRGKILYERPFSHLVNAMVMMTHTEAILLLTREDVILTINLQNYELNRIPFRYMNEGTDLSQILTFSESKMMCVREWGEYGDHRMKLSYFLHPLATKPVAVYQSKDDEWTCEYLVRRANNTSKVIWFKQRQDEQIEIRCCQTELVKEKWLIVFNIFTVKNELGVPYGMSRINLAVTTAWQMQTGQFMLVCISGKSELGKVSLSSGVIQNIYVFNTSTLTVREAYFYFDKEYNDYIIDPIYLGRHCSFRTFFFETGRAKPSPVYYVDSFSEEIVDKQLWECGYQYKLFVPGYDGSSLIECQYQNSDVHEIVVCCKRVIDPKLISVHLLLEVFPDFDDDLLKEAVQFLPSSYFEK